MIKSNLFKSSILLVIMIAVFMLGAITAYADDSTGNGYDYDNSTYENGEDTTTEPPVEDEQPIQEPLLGSLIIINSTHDGALLHGAVFAVYRVGEDARNAELATDTTGRTMELPLPQGNYNIVAVLPAHNHAPIANVITTTITAGQRQEITIFSVSTLPQTPPPTIEAGRLLLTLKEHDTGQHLSGAVYELRRAMDGEFIAYLITDAFGEAVIDLPIGDYFVREIQAVSGFIPNPDRVNVRIAANRLNELNLTSRPEQAPPNNQQPTEPVNGRLIVTLRADGTREQIQGATFEVRRAMDNRIVAELTTDRFGEAMANLPPDDYFLRQLSSPQGYEFSAERVNVRIAEGAIREVTVTNRRQVQTPPPEQTPPPSSEVADGRLLITVTSSETRERLEGVVYTIHDVMTDEVITTITTNAFGEASAHLQPGQYFIRNTVMVQEYVRELERIHFTIRAGAITNQNITARPIPQSTPDPTPTPVQTTPPAQMPSTSTPSTPSLTTTPSTPNRPTQRNVEVFTRAETSGNPLHGATFAVYRVSDNQNVGEITTNVDGKATISLNAGDYYLRNNSVQFGFLREQSRIFFTVAEGNVYVEVTIQRDPDIPYAEVGIITLPQTGELPPVMNYVLGILFLAVSLLCGAVLFYLNKHDKQPKHPQNKNLRKGARAYA